MPNHPFHPIRPDHSRADFKALRETLGVPQKWLAEQLDVSLKTMQRWEDEKNEKWYQPPEHAWQFLEKIQTHQHARINETLAHVHTTPPANNTITLTYYRRSDKHSLDYPVEIMNATIRATALILTHHGYTVTFAYTN
ncbi:helix-turn-helix domain-containing protein [Alloscardovia criceti]|uniref:helix-turn-helix domain-containing protein n=1 Tax=Alloscardovia criceti TaxID=356828 RepID=UPI00036E86AE|nr:helix-turn-helix domain-containing protein [Alloscardovia criceti]